jgi:hypothetical protein
MAKRLAVGKRSYTELFCRAFSVEGEGWDEGYINSCFYSTPPRQQERELGRLASHCIDEASCADSHATRGYIWRSGTH